MSNDDQTTVYCPAGHQVGVIKDGVLHMSSCGPLRSTEKGFVPSCPVCGVALREWTVPWWKPLFSQMRRMQQCIEQMFCEVNEKVDRVDGRMEYFM